MARVIGLLFLLGTFSICKAQQLADDRMTAWSLAGTTTAIQAPSNSINILEFGADNSGNEDCSFALEAAKSYLNGSTGTIYFPAGEYRITSTINLPDSVFLKGESSETNLRFHLGGSGHCIVMNGSIANQEFQLSESALKGDYSIELDDASEFEVGDYIQISMYDEDYMYSSWAYGSLSQLVRITEVAENTLLFEDPLSYSYPLTRNPVIRKATPRIATGIECLSITREDATSGQTHNVFMNYTTNCVVRNVESKDCNFAHIDMKYSSHNVVEGSYFHHAHAYGGGGQGYGVVAQYGSSCNLIQNNIFEHLRHSMLLQAGANANVFAYNYSIDPYWVSGFLPSNSAGDAVLHGNYVTMNLFEGNVVQNIVVDASHGSNGPFNTFFRNRAELYGLFSDSGTPTDSMNVIGNEVTNSGFPYGLFMLNGTGHHAYGNNHSGTPTPSGSDDLEVNSLYLNQSSLPEFLSTETLPMIGYPLAMNEKTIPAEVRFQNQNFVSCSASIVTDISASEEDSNAKPSFDGSTLSLPQELLPATLRVFDTNGRLVREQSAFSNQSEVSQTLSNGVYIIQCQSEKEIHNLKVLISR